MTEETRIQAAVVQHLQLRAPKAVAIHPANGGRRDIVTAVQLKRMGVVPGASDLIILDDSKFHALELKKLGGRTSDLQREFLERVALAGGYGAVAHGLDEALETLKKWGII